MTQNFDLYRSMLLIRRFEERALAEFSAGKLFGTTHAYIGQEADAAAIFSAVSPGDIVWSNHRCHGHFLAYGGDPYKLAAELMGKATGLVGGRGGSQHIHWRNFYSNGIQGGIVPVATGMAYAEKVQKTGQIAIVFIGDGTLGEGALYESLNIAALWQLPVFFVVETTTMHRPRPSKKVSPVLSRPVLKPLGSKRGKWIPATCWKFAPEPLRPLGMCAGMFSPEP